MTNLTAIIISIANVYKAQKLNPELVRIFIDYKKKKITQSYKLVGDEKKYSSDSSTETGDEKQLSEMFFEQVKAGLELKEIDYLQLDFDTIKMEVKSQTVWGIDKDGKKCKLSF